MNSLGNCPFFHYTSLSKFKAICDSKTLRFSKAGTSNDPYEKLLEGKYLFSFCTSRKGDKIPLWYLYGDIFGKGVALKITPNHLRLLLDEMVTLTACKDGCRKILNRGKDFEVDANHVLYKYPGNAYKYHGKVITADDFTNKEDSAEGYASSFVSIEEHYRDYLKGGIWDYEQEMRVVVTMKDKNHDNYDYLEYDLSGVSKLFSVYFAPFIDDADVEEVMKDNIFNLNYQTSNMKDADMRLYDRNVDSLVRYLKRNPDKWRELRNLME